MSTNNQESPTDAAAAASEQQGRRTPGPVTAASGGNLRCQWVGCGECCNTPGLLYDHVCERHVGRKSTNNLQLKCQWESCRTTTVTRDRIISHIRVHVPMRPHECKFCGKAFKRPQELKNHVKAHADDSVILRSPGPDQGEARPANVYNVCNGKRGGFYKGPMNPSSAPTYHHAPNAYYQPKPQQHSSDHGTVYYGVNGSNEGGHQMNYASKKRRFDARNDLFGDLKRRQIDPSHDAAFGQRLYDVQSLQLPVLQNNPVPGYQQMPAMATAGGAKGYHPSSMPAYSLPPMGNVRTKGDLMTLDQLLETMQTTICENRNHVAAAGVAQPGAYHGQVGAHYRTSNLPPGHQLSSSHAHARMTSSESVHREAPAFTPSSGAQSYTSSHSPPMPPPHHLSPAPQSTGGMYPSLPSTSMQDSMSGGYPGTLGASTSTFGTSFGADDCHRYGGGILQRAQSAPGNETDTSVDSPIPPTKTSPTKSTLVRKREKTELVANLVDPALNGLASLLTVEKTTGEEAQEQRAENFRLVQCLREYVKGILERGQFKGDDDDMKDIEQEDEVTFWVIFAVHNPSRDGWMQVNISSSQAPNLPRSCDETLYDA